MSKHTPGPWINLPYTNRVVRRFKASNGVVIEQAIAEAKKSTYVSGQGYVKNSKDAIQANALLIAEAPELLAVLKKLVEAVGCHCEETHTGEVLESRYLCPIHEAERVIAKAEGRE